MRRPRGGARSLLFCAALLAVSSGCAVVAGLPDEYGVAGDDAGASPSSATPPLGTTTPDAPDAPETRDAPSAPGTADAADAPISPISPGAEVEEDDGGPTSLDDGSGGAGSDGGGGGGDDAGSNADAGGDDATSGNGGSDAGASSDAGPAPPSCESVGGSCVPAPPPGWAGPLARYEGPASAPPPACAGAFATPGVDAHDGIVAPPASCSACACGAPSDVLCGAPSLRFYASGSSACSATCAADAPVTSATSCQDVSTAASACGTNRPRLAIVEPAASGGACVASPQTPQVAPWSWASLVKGCFMTSTPATVGCGAAEVCAPPPAAPFAARVCVERPGDLVCPHGFSDRHVVYDSAVDTRSCTACSCGAPSGATCAGAEIDVFSSNACSSSQQAVTSTTCGATPHNVSSALLGQPATPTGGSCAASGGAPAGAVAPSGATTICCLP